MDATTTLETLRALGKAGTAKIYRRHGVTGDCFGVGYGDLDRLKKQLRTDHALARALWASGNHDARILATRVADPGTATPAELRAWLGEADNYVITDALAALAARTAAAPSLARAWIDEPGEWVAAAGWGVLAQLALDGRLPAGEAAALLERIEAGIQAAPNRVRHSMNGALIAIGGAMEPLRPAALAAAARIGVVRVDHGETGCVTPDAAGYIAKMAERPAPKGKARRG